MILEAQDLEFRYRRNRPVLKNVSFKIEGGETVALLGRNGAGKTTLFRLMLGILKSGKGKFLINGEDICSFKKNDIAKHISYIPQMSKQEFSYTVLETVLMGSAHYIPLFSAPGEKEKRKALGILQIFNMDGLCDRNMTELSGGERQMVLIARALMQDTDFIILDEPTASLDYGNQILVLETLEKLRRRGAGLLFSTHNPEQALMYATRILLMDDSTIVFSGSKENLVSSHLLESLYGRNLFIDQVDTGANRRYICIPQ